MRRKRSARRAMKRATHAPPLRDGINASEIRLPEFDSAGNPVQFRTLGQWAEAGWGEAALAAFRRGDYLADGNVRLTVDTPYCPGERIWVFRPVLDEPEQPIELAVIAENERYLVVEKPHGMATIPRGSHVANTVTVAARRQFHNDLLVAAHRLDLETAGLVLLTKAPEYRAKYQLVFQNRQIRKSYLAAAPIGTDFTSDFMSETLQSFTDGQMRRVELPLYRPQGEIGVAVLHRDPSESEWDASAAKIRPWLASTDLRLLRTIQKQDFIAGVSSVGVAVVSAASAGVNGNLQQHLSGYTEAVGFRKEVGGKAAVDCEMNVMNQVSVCEKIIHLRDFAALPESWGIYQLQPHSGYMHQLRVTMNHLGIPIFGDPLYPVRLSKADEAARDFPLQLLARVLEFDDPITGEYLRFTSKQKLVLDLPENNFGSAGE